MTLPQSTFDDICRNYAQFYERLSPETLEEIDKICTPDLYFQDPFNKLNSLSSVKILFRDMFEKSEQYQFKTLGIYPNAEKREAIIKWHFKADIEKVGKLSFEGLSEIKVNDANMVYAHVDYWDAAEHFYMKLPLLKQLIGFVRKRLKVPGS